MPEPKNWSQSSLMTGDFDFIHDQKPRSTNQKILRLPWEESGDNAKEPSVVNRHPKKISDEEQEETNGKPLASPMDKICRKKNCIHIETCLAIINSLHNAQNRKDIEKAEMQLELAYNQK